MQLIIKRLAIATLAFLSISCWAAETVDNSAVVLTPPAAPAPHINGPTIFGVRPKSPFRYTIPATGNRPMAFSVENLPAGLTMNSKSGLIVGVIDTMGEYTVVLHAYNASGTDQKRLRIVVGDKIALTPPMGWNSWNCWAESVDQQKVLRSAKAMVSSGLINHGWSYINIDDTWQGKRSGEEHALQPNEKFSDMKSLCDAIHELGLKAGIYSTPWITSYAQYPGGTSASANGEWSKTLTNGSQIGGYSFAKADANQWAAWGFDYLKYDWYPIDLPSTREMSLALRNTGRDIVFSLSNRADFNQATNWAAWANSWRTTGDIWDRWGTPDKNWQFGVSEIGFSQDRWASYSGPSHWNDPDMLVVGQVGWGKSTHTTTLTPDEQYSHISMWCMLSAPLLIGCDLEKLDAFTLNLLGNDEVLALDQDALGKQATRVATVGSVDIYRKELEDGSIVLGFFNRESSAQQIGFNKLKFIGIKTPQHVRDLWRQANLADISNPANGNLQMSIPAHGVQLYKLTPIEANNHGN